MSFKSLWEQSCCVVVELQIEEHQNNCFVPRRCWVDENQLFQWNGGFDMDLTYCIIEVFKLFFFNRGLITAVFSVWGKRREVLTNARTSDAMQSRTFFRKLVERILKAADWRTQTWHNPLQGWDETFKKARYNIISGAYCGLLLSFKQFLMNTGARTPWMSVLVGLVLPCLPCFKLKCLLYVH